MPGSAREGTPGSARGRAPGPALARDRVRARLAAAPHVDAKDRLLAQAEGPVPEALLSLLEQPAREAAVLVGLVERAPGWTVLLTERAPHLQHHPGQVSFPGGRIAGAEDAVAAALREAREEVGLRAELVEIAGCMGEHVTGTGFRVTPVVGFVSGSFVPRPDPGEVDDVFEVPLEVLRAPGAFSIAHRERFGARFRTYELRYEGHRIWGATAAMLVNFMELISDGS